MGDAVPTVTPGSVPDVHSTISEMIRAATKTPKLQKIPSHREMVVPRMQSAPLVPCPEPPHIWLGHSKGVCSECLLISAAARQHLVAPGPVFADLLGGGGGGGQGTLCLFGLISRHPLGLVMSMWGECLGVTLW